MKKMKLLRTSLVVLLLVVVVVGLGRASDTNLNFQGDGSLCVAFTGYDVGLSSINSIADTNLGIRSDVLQFQGDFVSGQQTINSFSVDRFVEVAGGSAGFDQTYQGLGSYGMSVEAYNGQGMLYTHRVPTITNSTFYAGATALSDHTISQYASNDTPPTSLEVTESALTEDGAGSSGMLVSWGPDSLYDNSFWFLEGGWSTENRLDGLNLYLSSDGFWTFIRSKWLIPAIIEIIEYPEEAVLILKEPLLTGYDLLTGYNLWLLP